MVPHLDYVSVSVGAVLTTTLMIRPSKGRLLWEKQWVWGNHEVTPGSVTPGSVTRDVIDELQGGGTLWCCSVLIRPRLKSKQCWWITVFTQRLHCAVADKSLDGWIDPSGGEAKHEVWESLVLYLLSMRLIQQSTVFMLGGIQSQSREYCLLLAKYIFWPRKTRELIHFLEFLLDVTYMLFCILLWRYKKAWQRNVCIKLNIKLRY